MVSGEDFDGAPGDASAFDPSIAGDQRQIQDLGEGDILGFVGTEVVMQVADPWSEDQRLVAHERQETIVADGLLGLPLVDLAAADHLEEG